MRRAVFFALVAVLLAAIGLSVWQIGSYVMDSRRSRGQYQELAQLRQEATVPKETEPTVTVETVPEEKAEMAETVATEPPAPEVLPELAGLLAVNPDLVGWIRVPGTVIDYPVVQRPGERDWYLKRDFYGQKSSAGCIYAREVCDVALPSDNVTLYGHMMRDGSMFAQLNFFTNRKFWEEHRVFRFDSLYAHRSWEVVCVFRAEAQGEFQYQRFVEFGSAAEFGAFWDECQARAVFDTGVAPQWGDKLLCLSTCEYTLQDGRLVVLARMVEG